MLVNNNIFIICYCRYVPQVMDALVNLVQSEISVSIILIRKCVRMSYLMLINQIV